jgi:exodeoxyribonuclease VII large subunit
MDELLIFSVSEVSFHLKQVVETQIEHLYVRGEIANFTAHNSGHMYFSIKDDRSTLRCTFFRNVNLSLDFVPENGMEVVCFGKLSIYEKGGTYNLNVLKMSVSGKGDLQKRFEILRSKLEDEGLFDKAHKQILPRFPERIGIVTSPTGAALQDIRNIMTRRFPVEVYVYPALVQGDDAPAELIAGVKYFNDIHPVDLIIITRGGGSQEDLFCFNDEALARHVFASRIPVISAVGHEIDFTIVDYVADLRAPTPSAAAEIAVPDKKDLLAFLQGFQGRMEIMVSGALSRSREALELKYQKLARVHPVAYLQSMQQRLDMASIILGDSTRVLGTWNHDIDLIGSKITSAIRFGSEKIRMLKRNQLPGLYSQMRSGIRENLGNREHRLNTLEAKLELLSPMGIMDKGYSIVVSDGTPVGSVSKLIPDQDIEIYMRDGSATASVVSITKGQSIDKR